MREKGWANTQEMIGLIEQLKHAARKPDIVLFYDGGTEAFAAYQSGRADVHSNYNSFKNFLDNWGASQKAGFSYFRQTNTYRFLEKIALRAPFHNKKRTRRPRRIGCRNALRGSRRKLLAEHGHRELCWRSNTASAQFSRGIPTWRSATKQLTPYEQQVLNMEYQKFPGLGAMYQATSTKRPRNKSPGFSLPRRSSG